MIQTDLPAGTTVLSAAQQDKIKTEGFLTFGNCLTPQELTAARLAYEPVMEAFSPDDARYGGGDMERAAFLPAFGDCPDLLKLIANPTIIAIAEAALGTSDIEYIGSILRRTRFDADWVRESGVGSWHADYWLLGDPAQVRDERVAIWIYLDDVTKAEGATQLIPGSSEIFRRSQCENRDFSEALQESLAPGESVSNSFVEAPAGGGMAFKSRVIHRAIANTSGIPRRVMTMDYRVRGTTEVPDGEWQKLPVETKQILLQSLPESALYLVQ